MFLTMRTTLFPESKKVASMGNDMKNVCMELQRKISKPSPSGSLLTPIRPFILSKSVRATFALTPFMSTYSIRNIISSYAIIKRYGFMQTLSARMQRKPQIRHSRILRRRFVSEGIQMGAPLRRGAPACRGKRKRVHFLFKVHDEMPLLPKLPLELERER